MPDLGDYITRLMCDASKYTTGTDQARNSTMALTGSCNTIIGALGRQKRALDTVGQSTLDWIEADKKASNEVKEHARALLVEVDALHKKQAALAAVAAEQARVVKQGTEMHGAGGYARGGSGEYSFPAAGPAANTEPGSGRYTGGNDLYGSGINPQSHAEMMAEMARKRRQGAGGLDILSDSEVAADQQAARRRAGAGRDQQEADEAKARDNADRIRKEQQRVRGDRQGEADEERKVSEAEANAIREGVKAKLRARYEGIASERSAMAEDRRTSRQRLGDMLNDENVMQQLEDQGYKKKVKPGHVNQAGKDNRKWAGVEGFRAIEDFAQGSAFGGLRGGLLAASNNISQMGAAYGAAGAMAGSAVSTVVVLGSQLYETWRKAASGADAATSAIKEYDRMLSSVIPHLQTMNEMRRVESRGLRNETSMDSSDRTVQSLKDDIARREDALLEEQKARADRDRSTGTTGLAPGDLTKEATERKDGGFFGWAMRQVSLMQYGEMQGVEGQRRRLPEETLTPEAISQRQEADRKNTRDNDVLVEKKRQLQIAERRNLELAQSVGQAQADQQQAMERSRRVGGAGPLTEWQQMDKERGFANEHNAKEKSKFERGQSWVQSRQEDLLLSGMKSDKERSYYKAEKEHQETLRRSAEAERLGVMTPMERLAMDSASVKKRDRDVRLAKYGDLQADGNSGFQSADIKSSQGFNAFAKAMRYGQQDDAIGQLKKNGETEQEIKTAIDNLAAVLTAAPIPVENFN